MMAEYQIAVEFANPKVEATPVRLADLIRALGAVRRALLRTDSAADPVDWQVEKLTSNSPITATIEPIADPGQREHGKRVVEAFFRYANKIQDGSYEGISRDVLGAFLELTRPVDAGRLRVEIRNSHASVAFRRGISHEIKAMLAPETTALGNVKGQLEFINLHRGENVFRIYPPIGPSFVECRFSRELKEDAQLAVGRNVRVHGRLHYRMGDDVPYRIDVHRIHVLPLDSELPTLLDVLGMAPAATGNYSSEDFVRSVRLAREP
jgi:hypothetical protein